MMKKRVTEFADLDHPRPAALRSLRLMELYRRMTGRNKASSGELEKRSIELEQYEKQLMQDPATAKELRNYYASLQKKMEAILKGEK